MALWPFAVTLFVGSALMFLVEPMIAKMVLPTLGGTAMIWNTCVVFFQSVLLAGYAYSWALSRWLDVRRQALVHTIVLALPLLVLPFAVHFGTAPPEGSNPVWWLLLLLASTIGLPFFSLSTSSVLQHWFSRTGHAEGADPYFLYAINNVGSLSALLAYPTIVEPSLRLAGQSHLWAAGYTIFVGAAVICAIVVWRRPSVAHPRKTVSIVDRASDVRPSWVRRLKWVASAAVPSSLMLAVTIYLSTDLAPVPLLWVVPLALYLLTFVLAFSRSGPRYRTLADRLLPLTVIPIALFMLAEGGPPLMVLVPLHLLALVAAGLVCHGALVADRPDVSHLTEFYFWIALGGVVGGLFNTLIAPIAFKSIVEYPLGLVLACLLRPSVEGHKSQGRFSVRELAVPAAVGLSATVIFFITGRIGHSERLVIVALALPAFLSFRQSRRPMRFALCLVAFFLAGMWHTHDYGRILFEDRTFFGVYKVVQGADGQHNTLLHGTTIHGTQALAEAQRREPLRYFHRTGPIGQAFLQLPVSARTSNVAVAGLGIGSLAAYARSGQHWTFFEIDPALELIARNERFFTYLHDCGDRCQVVTGDARLSLARTQAPQFGVIVLDAFTSDAIPVHLLTSEALDLYLSRLTPDGVLAFNVSNTHVAVAPVLARLAITHGLVAIDQFDRVSGEMVNGKSSSEWILMARHRDDLEPLVDDPRWRTPRLSSSTPLWTDDYTNLLAVLTWR
jgi:hypothetical protein